LICHLVNSHVFGSKAQAVTSR